MGAKQSSGARTRTYSNAGDGAPYGSNGAGGLGEYGGPSTSGGMTGVVSARGRARSLGSVQNGAHGHPLGIPTSNGATQGAGSPDSDDSTPEEGPSGSASGSGNPMVGHPFSRGLLGLQASSLPLHLFPFHAGIKCPVCSKFVPPDDIECHLVMCLTKPRIIYNEDVLTEDKGECVICLDELQQGDTIARLPCLCIYHKGCIDAWFKVNRTCPEHPGD